MKKNEIRKFFYQNRIFDDAIHHKNTLDIFLLTKDSFANKTQIKVWGLLHFKPVF